MKSYKQLLNEWARQSNLLHEMTEEERAQLRSTLLAMYQDIAQLANANGLKILLAGGSALGAIRHKGFIPWDDDLDCAMHRKDYNKFIYLLEAGKLGEKYEFRYPNGKQDTTCCFLKIYKKGTVYAGVLNEYTDMPQGIFIDVFPLDHTPSNCFIRKMKGHLADALRLISNCIQEYTCAQKNYVKIKKYPELYSFMKKRMIIGRIFSIVQHKKWVYWYDSLVADDKTEGMLCIPTGRKLYNGEVFKYEDYLPGTKAKFEGLDVYVPQNIDAYLTNLYHNYMELPPEEKRERHIVGKFKI